MNKKDLIRKIKDIDGLTSNEKAELIELLNTQKRYGLVWEDKPEDVENELREKLPVLVEVKEKAIISDKGLGNGDRELGNGDRELGFGDKGLGNGDRELGNGDRELGFGDRELGFGDKGLGIEDREMGFGDKNVYDNIKGVSDEYDKELQRSGSLENSDGFSCANVSDNKKFSEGGNVPSGESDTQISELDTRKYSGRTLANTHKGVYSTSINSEGITGRTGNSSHSIAKDELFRNDESKSNLATNRNSDEETEQLNQSIEQKNTLTPSPHTLTPSPHTLIPNPQPPTPNPHTPTPNPQPPNHILIEGDNLHALTVLNYTHAGMIDVIYIDPPYNTGNKDFKYNDRFVDREDSYRHSKWLSFMAKRLKIARNLLKDTGVIFISIDDNEQAQLKLLCDEIFGEGNFINNISIKVRDNAGESGGGEDKKLKKNIEYLLFYSNFRSNYNLPKQYTEINLKNVLLEKYIENDKYVYNSVLINTVDRQYFTTILDGQGNDIIIYKYKDFETKSISKLCQEENLSEIEVYVKYYDKIFTTYNARTSIRDRLRSSIDDFNGLIEIEYIPKSGKYKNVLTKKYFSGNTMRLWAWLNEISYKKNNGDIVIKSPLGTLWDDISWASLSTEGGIKFENGKKPVSLLNRILKHIENPNSIVLDFFAGSGTTLHATMQLNAEDGGTRQCILVTNNENNIAEEVCYERNKRVIEGYTKPNGDKVAGLKNNNFRYYKTDYVPSAKTEVNRRKLTEASTELLQIKEDCYFDITKEAGFERKYCCISTNKNGKYLVVVYHSRKQAEVTDELNQYIKEISDLKEKVCIYAFGTEVDVLLDDFFDVKEKINVVPLPDAIYNAYRSTFRTLQLDRKTKRTNQEDEIKESEDEGMLDFISEAE